MSETDSSISQGLRVTSFGIQVHYDIDINAAHRSHRSSFLLLFLNHRDSSRQDRPLPVPLPSSGRRGRATFGTILKRAELTHRMHPSNCKLSQVLITQAITRLAMCGALLESDRVSQFAASHGLTSLTLNHSLTLSLQCLSSCSFRRRASNEKDARHWH